MRHFGRLRNQEAGEGAGAGAGAGAAVPAPSATPTGGASEGDRSPVPYSRFAEVNALARERAEQVKALQGELEAARGATGRLTELEATLAAERGQAAVLRDSLDLARAGLIDEEAIDVARLYHGRLPADGRPTLAAWYANLQADPTLAPKGLQHWLAAPTTPSAPRPAGAPVTPASPPASDKSASTHRLRELADRMARGDKSAIQEWDALRKG